MVRNRLKILEICAIDTYRYKTLGESWNLTHYSDDSRSKPGLYVRMPMAAETGTLASDAKSTDKETHETAI